MSHLTLSKVVHKQVFPNVCSFETSRFVYISPGLSPIQRSQHFHGTHYHAAFYNITMTIVLSRAPQSAGLIQTLSVEGVRNIQEHKGGCLAKVTQVAFGKESILEEALQRHPSSTLLLLCLGF